MRRMLLRSHDNVQEGNVCLVNKVPVSRRHVC